MDLENQLREISVVQCRDESSSDEFSQRVDNMDLALLSKE